ncbi:hypothetical protein [Micromonospora radicis]|uniref:Uncharacterized protein n=1 Tax=Micromonospora radicis TaxID=1894971 RepID=A0A418MYF8_9ACTN|nr:hypothetical protein [Micromonospora radicis]RIV40054.1 hypothetical protein D2L64_06970 [Micromonospora radicis]
MRTGDRRDATGESPERVGQRNLRTSPPDNEFPAGVVGTVLLGRTGDVAVGISNLLAYSTGFQFTLTVRLRRTGPDLVGGRLFALVSSHGHPGVDIPVDDRLLLGLEYADSRRAANLYGTRPPETAADDDQMMLLEQGGSGDEHRVDQHYWVSPLPPEGPVTVVLAWPGLGLPESRTVLDGTAIRVAAAGTRTLWPPQPSTEPVPPPPPPRPASGWFAEPAG